MRNYYLGFWELLVLRSIANESKFTQTIKCMKIFLIGFMGAGKSLIGKHLAARLGLDFIDMDTVLEAKEGMSIQEIFLKFGEDYFRKSEAQSLRELAGHSNAIIATGGGMPCYFENMEWMNEHGITIFLDVTVEELSTRLRSESNKRPLLQGKAPKELNGFIETKLKERIGFYSQAQFICHASYPWEELVEGLAKYFNRFL